jgi:outer membrane protein assembly factor BamB
MKIILLLPILFLLSCSSDKDKKVDLDVFRKQGEKINVFESKNIFDKEIEVNNSLQINQPKLNKMWAYEHFSSSNSYDHLVYLGTFSELLKKNIGDFINKKNDSGSILAIDDFVFIADEKGVIYKFDLNTEKLLWETKIYKNSYNDYPKKITMLLNNNLLFVADNLGFIYCIDTSTGKPIWQQDYGIPFSSHLNFYKDVLYVVNQNSRLYAFNPQDGQKIWSFESLSGLIKPSRSSSIAIYENKLLFSNDVGDVTAIDLDQQVILWTRNIISQNSISANLVFRISNILIDKKDVYVSSNNGDLLNLNIDNGELKWSQKLSSIQNHVSTDKYLFVLTENGYVVAFNKSNGSILWSLNLEKFNKDSKNSTEYYGVILANTNLYVTSSKGEIFKISATEGKYVSHKKINSELTRAPIIINNKILLLNQSSELIVLN